MASSNDKLTADAKRASSRGFGGYLADRALGRADFSKSATATPAVARPMGGNNPANSEAIKAMKNGGLVKVGKGSTPYKCK